MSDLSPGDVFVIKYLFNRMGTYDDFVEEYLEYKDARKKAIEKELEK